MESDFSAILRKLCDCNVDFLVVGGLSAILNGAPVNTFDLDLVHRVLDLETLIAIKEELGGEKDLAVLPILRRTLEERKKLGYTPQQ